MSIIHALDFTNNTTITLRISSHQKTLLQLKDFTNSLLKDLSDTNLKKHLSLAIDEMLQNAYEHGNLEISSEEKRKLLENNGLAAELSKRENEFGKREIVLEIQLTKEDICIKVSNQGKSFDWEALIDDIKKNHSIDKIVETSGNGIPLLLKISDEFYYENNARVCIFKKRIG